MSCSGTKRVSIQHHERMGHIDDRCSRRRHRYHNPPSALQIVGGIRSNGLAGRLRGNAGVVTEAVLKVTSAPVNLHVAVATFQNLRAAVETAICLIGDNPPVDALELLGQYSMRAINLYGLSHRRWSETSYFFSQIFGLALCRGRSGAAGPHRGDQKPRRNIRAAGGERRIETSWGVRKSVGKSLFAMKKDATDLFLTANAAVPISRLADMIDETH